jgi:hypothetical protein
MELLLQREKSSVQSTQGKLYVDGEFECHTLEDPVRDKKIFGQTAIPAGRYHVEITWSDHFGKLLPLIEHVPNFDGVGYTVVIPPRTLRAVSLLAACEARIASRSRD